MKTLLALAGSLFVLSGGPAPALPTNTLDTAKAAPSLIAYDSATWSTRWRLRDGGTTFDLTGYTPIMWWATGLTASATYPTTGTVVNATNGLFDATFARASMSTGGVLGIYGVAVVSGAVQRTFGIGDLTLRYDPYSSGAGGATWATSVTITAAQVVNWDAVSGAYTGGTIKTNYTDTLSNVCARGNAYTGGVTLGTFPDTLGVVNIGSGSPTAISLHVRHNSGKAVYGDGMSVGVGVFGDTMEGYGVWGRATDSGVAGQFDAPDGKAIDTVGLIYENGTRVLTVTSAVNAAYVSTTNSPFAGCTLYYDGTNWSWVAK